MAKQRKPKYFCYETMELVTKCNHLSCHVKTAIFQKFLDKLDQETKENDPCSVIPGEA